MSTLDLRYQRLMFAYPREYRRQRAAEIAGTLADMAPAARRWPRGRDAVSLFIHGMRARLGRPGSRFIVVAALLVAVVGGFCAAAGGAWLGWRTTSGQLSAGQTMSYGAQILPGSSSPWSGTGSQGSAAPGVPSLPLVSRYDLAPTLVVSTWSDDVTASEAAIRQHLAGSGWTVTSVANSGDVIAMSLRNGHVAADLRVMTGSGTLIYVATVRPESVLPPTSTGSTTDVLRSVNRQTHRLLYRVTPSDVLIYRVTPWEVPTFATIAGLLGALCAYLLIGWLSRRAMSWPRRQQASILTLASISAICAAPAAIVCAVGFWASTFGGVQVPVIYWAGFVAADLRPAILAAGIALVLAIAAIALVGTPSASAEVTAPDRT